MALNFDEIKKLQIKCKTRPEQVCNPKPPKRLDKRIDKRLD